MNIKYRHLLLKQFITKKYHLKIDVASVTVHNQHCYFPLPQNFVFANKKKKKS